MKNIQSRLHFQKSNPTSATSPTGQTVSYDENGPIRDATTARSNFQKQNLMKMTDENIQ